MTKPLFHLLSPPVYFHYWIAITNNSATADDISTATN